MSRAPVVTNRIPIGDERRRERTVMVRGYDSTSTTYDELFAHFAQVGSVEALKMIRDDDGRDHAFVDYFNPDAAQRAVAGLNYSELRTGSHMIFKLRVYARKHRVERDAVAPAPAPAPVAAPAPRMYNDPVDHLALEALEAEVEAIHAAAEADATAAEAAAARRAAATAAAAADALPPTVVGQLVPGPLYAAGLHDVTLRADEAAPAPAPATEPRAVLESWSAGDVAAFCKSLGFPATTTALLLENLVDGPMLAEITDDELSTEIKMTKLQIRRLRRELANVGRE